MKKRVYLIPALILLLCLALYPQEKPVLIKAVKIVPMTGKPLTNRMILLHKGKIKSIAQNIKESGARVVDVKNGWVLPGLIEAHTSFGTSRGADEISDPSTPQLRIIDALNPFSKDIIHAREGGITTIMASPGRLNVIGGQSAVLKLSGNTVEKMIVSHPAGIKFSLGEGPRSTYGKKGRLPSTRMGSAYVIRKALLEAQDYIENNEKKRDLEKEPLVKLLKGELKAFVECHRADDIMTALRLTDEFKLKSVLVGCTEGYEVADEIAVRNIPVIISTYGIGPRRMETQDVRLDTPAILHKAGVTIVLKTEGMFGLGNVRELPLLAALAVKYGLPKDIAQRAITSTAAEVLGVSDRLGSLEEGKDADLVIFDGDPFQYKTRITHVFINGQPVYEKKK